MAIAFSLLIDEKIGHVRLKRMNGPYYKAYYLFSHQRQRCYNPKNNRYKYYGAKGIRVEYTKLDFINWFIQQVNLKGLDWTQSRLAVGRIDHNKNYSFDNIEIQTLRENSLERIHRNGTVVPSRPIVVKCLSGDELKFDSIKHASRSLGISDFVISKYLKSKKLYEGMGFHEHSL